MKSEYNGQKTKKSSRSNDSKNKKPKTKDRILGERTWPLHHYTSKWQSQQFQRWVLEITMHNIKKKKMTSTYWQRGFKVSRRMLLGRILKEGHGLSICGFLLLKKQTIKKCWREVKHATLGPWMQSKAIWNC